MKLKKLQEVFIKAPNLMPKSKFERIALSEEHKLAVYKRTPVEAGEHGTLYEVIHWSIKPAETDDGENTHREAYPGAGSFGQRAWQMINENSAMAKFHEMTNKIIPNNDPFTDTAVIRKKKDSFITDADLSLLPSEFTVAMVRDTYHQSYHNARKIIHHWEDTNQITFSHNLQCGRGKPTKFYKKLT